QKTKSDFSRGANGPGRVEIDPMHSLESAASASSQLPSPFTLSPKHEHRRRPLPPEVVGAATGNCRHVLTALYGIGDDPAQEPRPGVEAIELAPAPSIEREEIAGQLTGEHDAASRRRHPGHHRLLGMMTPAHGAGRDVYGGEPALRLGRRIEDDLA